MNILLVGVGGFLGAIARYGLSQWMKASAINSASVMNSFTNLFLHSFPHSFPTATFVINILGCFIMGLIVQYVRNAQLYPTVSLFLGVGVLGAFTTFSAFGFETIELIRANELRLALAYAMGSVVVCLLAIYLGSWLSGHISR